MVTLALSGCGRSIWQRSVVRCLATLCLIGSASVAVRRDTASAEPQCLNSQPQIFPTAQTGLAAPWQWAFANGSQGTIYRYGNSFPCSTSFGNQRANAWTINMNLNTGDYLEAGYFETLSAVSGGVDEYRLFYETVSAGSVSFHIVAAPCSPPFPPSGKSGFRVRRYWATLWVLEVDCADNGTWQNLGTIDLPASPTWGNARGEMERFQRENGYNTLFTKLNWRQFNDATATWKPWVGMGCASTPAYWSTENLRRLSGSGFDFVSGTGQC